jgi:hypothetical protein
LTFVPSSSYGAVQLGFFWRFNPDQPPAVLPEKACVELVDEILLEVLIGQMTQTAIAEFKAAQDSPFSLEEWQGWGGGSG